MTTVVRFTFGLVLLLPAPLAASELSLVAHAVFGQLGPTAIFDNVGGMVTAADLTARTFLNLPFPESLIRFLQEHARV